VSIALTSYSYEDSISSYSNSLPSFSSSYSEYSMEFSDFSGNDDFSAPLTDDFSADDFSAVTDDFSAADDFSAFSGDYSANDDYSMEEISPAPTSVPTDIYDTLEPTERTSLCYADCTYPGMTLAPADWGEEEYCAFYEQSTTCSESSVSAFSCVPTCLKDCSDVFCDTMSALVFACDVTSRATYRNKTAVESECLASYAANSSTQTQLSFTSETEFGGVSPSEMDTPESRNAAIVAMSLAMSGVTTDDITITSITGTEARRLNILPKHLSIKTAVVGSTSLRNGLPASTGGADISVQAVSSTVNYQITVLLEQLGFSNTATTAGYDQLVAEISSSITSGKFQQNLKAAGATAGVTTFQSADVSKIPIYSQPQVIYLTTDSPTLVPSTSPTNAPSPIPSAVPTPIPSPAPTSYRVIKSKNEDDDDNTGAIVGGVIGGFFGLLCIGFLIYFFVVKGGDRSKLEESFRAHQFLAVSQGQGQGKESDRTSLGGVAQKEAAFAEEGNQGNDFL
jgi:hypothetical protein